MGSRVQSRSLDLCWTRGMGRPARNLHQSDQTSQEPTCDSKDKNHTKNLKENKTHKLHWIMPLGNGNWTLRENDSKMFLNVHKPSGKEFHIIFVNQNDAFSKHVEASDVNAHPNNCLNTFRKIGKRTVWWHMINGMNSSATMENGSLRTKMNVAKVALGVKRKYINNTFPIM